MRRVRLIAAIVTIYHVKDDPLFQNIDKCSRFGEVLMKVIIGLTEFYNKKQILDRIKLIDAITLDKAMVEENLQREQEIFNKKQ
jgi:hypothetical protein